MKSYNDMQELLLNEHQEKYDAFTKLMLGLSVGFITLTIGLKSGEVDFSSYKKIAILLHSISILCGIWLQYLLMVRPIEDLNAVKKIFSDSKDIKNGNGVWFSRNPSKIQTACFLLQVITFLVAFASVVIGVLL